MKRIEPSTETELAVKLCEILTKRNLAGNVAFTAAKVCAYARAIRKLTEQGCNVELTKRQESRRLSLKVKANEELAVYGLELDNPWGLCFYACPIGHDGSTQSDCTFLA